MIGYIMIWVIVLLFFIGFLILFSITLIRVGLEKWRRRRAGGHPDAPRAHPPSRAPWAS